LNISFKEELGAGLIGLFLYLVDVAAGREVGPISVIPGLGASAMPGVLRAAAAFAGVVGQRCCEGELRRGVLREKHPLCCGLGRCSWCFPPEHFFLRKAATPVAGGIWFLTRPQRAVSAIWLRLFVVFLGTHFVNGYLRTTSNVGICMQLAQICPNFWQL
jgi:hypothetical protein